MSKQNSWMDITTYSRSEKERIPRIWRHVPSGVVVHRHIAHDPDTWLLSWSFAGIKNRELIAEDIEAAKAEAKEICRVWLNECIKGLEQ